MSRRTIPVLAALLALAVIGVGTYLVTRPEPKRITLGQVSGNGNGSSTATGPAAPLRIAVAAMISPKETFQYYERILDYVSAKTGRHVQLVQRETYQEVNDLLESGDLDMAFVCTGAYVEGHKEFGMELLCAPTAYGAPVYYSYIIVPKDSPARSLEDLRGRRFAFTDPMSNTGYLVPVYMLGRSGETTTTFFSKTMFTYSHDASIETVAEGLADGAAVDSLVWDYMAAKESTITKQARIVEKSPPYGIPPVVVPPGLDPELKAELADVLLHMHEDSAGAAILGNVMIDRFVVVQDSSYDSVRRMQEWLAGHGG